MEDYFPEKPQCCSSNFFHHLSFLNFLILLGLVESFFANPFGPAQKEKETDVLINKYFDIMFKTGVKVGQIKTALGVKGQEKNGPKNAALQLFEEIKKL